MYTASGEVQPNDVTVQLARYARQALYAGIGLSSLFYVTLWMLHSTHRDLTGCPLFISTLFAITKGFPATLEIRENIENGFPIFQSGKTKGTQRREVRECKRSGETQGICDSDPEGKGFRHFGVCVSCAMCPSCVH